uniref:Ankyrin repeat domain-containing protein 24 n=1 Tax=Sphenodon punctatus TaxID=8508 RepID=A0A8D0H1Z6_SPHPU
MKKASDNQDLQEAVGELRQQLDVTAGQYREAEAQLGQLREEHGKQQQEVSALKERLASQVSKQDHEEAVGKLRNLLADSDRKVLELKEKHSATQRELAGLQKAAESYRRESVPLAEHARAKESLEGSVRELRARAKQLEQEVGTKAQEASRLQAELESTREGTVPKEEHEQVRCSLLAEVNMLKAKLSDLGRKHERTSTEVFQVQREALFMKSEKHAAEAQLAAVERQLKSLQAESGRLQELHGHIEDSARLVKEKDRKITELSKEVFKLKEALNSLSELSSQTGSLSKTASPKPPSQLEVTTTLQNKVKALEQQLVDAKKHHNNVVSLYRSHLLYAIQGHMDEDVQSLLFQILKMQKLQEQGR